MKIHVTNIHRHPPHTASRQPTGRPLSSSRACLPDDWFRGGASNVQRRRVTDMCDFIKGHVDACNAMPTLPAVVSVRGAGGELDVAASRVMMRLSSGSARYLYLFVLDCVLRVGCLSLPCSEGVATRATLFCRVAPCPPRRLPLVVARSSAVSWRLCVFERSLDSLKTLGLPVLLEKNSTCRVSTPPLSL